MPHMAVNAYYDGSGKSAPTSKGMTLTGVVAPETLWQRFVPLWEKALLRNSVQCLHMSDLMAARGEFERERGWTEEKRIQFIKDLFNIFGEFRTTGLRAYSCTIVLDDYRRCKTEIPKLRKPEDICVNFCVGGLQFTVEELSEEKPILLYFDRNEGFMNSIHQVWSKKRRRPKSWPKQIRSIATTNSSCFPIQAADLIAWIVNRRHIKGHDESYLYFSTFMMIEHFTILYDYERIVQDYRNG
jgi:hypothetical protein